MSAFRNFARKLKSVFIVALIFFCGVIVGGIIAGAAVVRDVTTKAYASGPAPMRRLLVQHAKEGLSLDEDQQHLFWSILSETGAEIKTATVTVQPELVRIMDRSERRLREVLRPEQTGRFDRWVQSTRENWSKGLSPDKAKAEIAQQ